MWKRSLSKNASRAVSPYAARPRFLNDAIQSRPLAKAQVDTVCP
jgi:hypothetical protein